MFEIELPIEKAGIAYIDSISRPIDTDMIICAKPGQMRHTKFPYKCCYVHMIVQSGLLYDALSDTPSCFKTDRTESYREIFSQLLRHYDTFSETDEIFTQSKLFELIYTVKTDSIAVGTIKKPTSSPDVIENTVKYIDSHLTEDLSLNRLAELNSMSAIHFHNKFKSATGKTLRCYIEEERIKKAIDLLYTTNYNLTQIAYECGFSSQSYFSYAFKRKMNCTPREYVKQIYNKYEI